MENQHPLWHQTFLPAEVGVGMELAALIAGVALATFPYSAECGARTVGGVCRAQQLFKVALA